ncbi:MAG: alpha/beta family hydrolase [Dehalococcoidia bacterium]
MTETTLQIDVPGSGAVTAIRTEPEGDAVGWLFVYAPGAGSNVHDPFGVYACRRLAGEGIAALRLQFPYMEARKRGPDRPPVLEATWRAAIDAVRAPGVRLVVGGRSMGGRIASQAVAQGVEVDALALFAYPLHPPGKPEQLRDKHLPSITVPALFCSGTRDAFASPDELRAAAAKVPRSTVHLLEGADHGFAVPKASGRTRDDVWSEAVDELLAWLREID